jgi:hypothetical protein
MALTKEQLQEIIATAKADNDNPIRQHPEIVDIEDTIDTTDYEEIEHVCDNTCQHTDLSHIPPAVFRVMQMKAKRLENQAKKKKKKR